MVAGTCPEELQARCIAEHEARCRGAWPDQSSGMRPLWAVPSVRIVRNSSTRFRHLPFLIATVATVAPIAPLRPRQFGLAGRELTKFRTSYGTMGLYVW